MRGAAGGLAGTAAHTAVMLAARSLGLGGKLPPKAITDRMLEHLGMQVSRLLRVGYGPFALGDLSRGAVAEIPQVQVERLRKSLKSSPDRGGGPPQAVEGTRGDERPKRPVPSVRRSAPATSPSRGGK